MVRYVEAKTLLSHSREPDPWFGIKYTMNLYRGCQHQCIYCDSRSACYRIENFADICIKSNAIELLSRELPRKRTRGTIGLGAMNDCYMPLETECGLTRQALEVIASHRFGVHIITKGALVERDIDLLRRISRLFAVVSFSITTADDGLAAKLEPGASRPSERFRAMRALADAGIATGVALMPVLPFIEDTDENIRNIVVEAHEHGASYVLPCMGMTQREGQREHFYRELDRLFPGVRRQYERTFGNRYECAARNAGRLERMCRGLCAALGVATSVPTYHHEGAQEQLSLF
jgi:DNA repair photolyase